ncbi:MAG: hypothetical protein WBF58_24485 [Xanthobacteraceae bacterium]
MESSKVRRYQIILVAAWLAVSGGLAIQRTLSVDPELAGGRKCVIISKVGPDYFKLNGLPENANPFDLFVPGNPNYNPNGECNKASLQAIIDLRLHPMASILGSLVPTVALAAVIYFLIGWLLYRYNARFKICEHCAQRIRSAAKVCRYCGRDISPQY